MLIPAHIDQIAAKPPRVTSAPGRRTPGRGRPSDPTCSVALELRSFHVVVLVSFDEGVALPLCGLGLEREVGVWTNLAGACLFFERK